MGLISKFIGLIMLVLMICRMPYMSSIFYYKFGLLYIMLNAQVNVM